MSGQFRSGRRWEVTVARYREIAEDLIDGIRAGRVAVGEGLPGELKLMRDYGASRHTIRDALRKLEELGLVERRRGVGTRVLSRRPARAYVHRVRRPAELLQYPSDNRLEVQDVAPVRIGKELARLLGCREGSRWVRVRAVRRRAGARPPICRLDLYLRPRYAGVAGSIGRRRELVFESIERRYGVHVAEVTVEIMARPMPADAAVVLGVEAGSPSMTVVRRYRDDRGEFIQVSVSEHPGDRYRFGQTLRRAWDTGAATWRTE
jgi:DNA-binding GntR family transcriptional regulator